MQSLAQQRSTLVEILGLAMAENTQHKLNTLRPPRVQITYDVMLGNGVEHKELPFVVGIMSDLSGMRANDPIPLKDRSFVGIYADNFNDIMSYIQPNLSLSVENNLIKSKSNLKVNLIFNAMEDFSPQNIIQQIPALKVLHQSRVNLKDLLSKMDGNDELETILNEIMMDPKQQQALMEELGMNVGNDKAKKAKDITPAQAEDIAKQTLEELPPVELPEKTAILENYDSPYENGADNIDPLTQIHEQKNHKKDDDFF